MLLVKNLNQLHLYLLFVRFDSHSLESSSISQILQLVASIIYDIGLSLSRRKNKISSEIPSELCFKVFTLEDWCKLSWRFIEIQGLCFYMFLTLCWQFVYFLSVVN